MKRRIRTQWIFKSIFFWYCFCRNSFLGFLVGVSGLYIYAGRSPQDFHESHIYVKKWPPVMKHLGLLNQKIQKLWYLGMVYPKGDWNALFYLIKVLLPEVHLQEAGSPLTINALSLVWHYLVLGFCCFLQIIFILYLKVELIKKALAMMPLAFQKKRKVNSSFT